jgi:hypothetical protein
MKSEDIAIRGGAYRANDPLSFRTYTGLACPANKYSLHLGFRIALSGRRPR